LDVFLGCTLFDGDVALQPLPRDILDHDHLVVIAWDALHQDERAASLQRLQQVRLVPDALAAGDRKDTARPGTTKRYSRASRMCSTRNRPDFFDPYDICARYDHHICLRIEVSPPLLAQTPEFRSLKHVV
jgi:hypothetical protein